MKRNTDAKNEQIDKLWMDYNEWAAIYYCYTDANNNKNEHSDKKRLEGGGSPDGKSKTPERATSGEYVSDDLADSRVTSDFGHSLMPADGGGGSGPPSFYQRSGSPMVHDKGGDGMNTRNCYGQRRRKWLIMNQIILAGIAVIYLSLNFGIFSVNESKIEKPPKQAVDGDADNSTDPDDERRGTARYFLFQTLCDTKEQQKTVECQGQFPMAMVLLTAIVVMLVSALILLLSRDQWVVSSICAPRDAATCVNVGTFGVSFLDIVRDLVMGIISSGGGCGAMYHGYKFQVYGWFIGGCLLQTAGLMFLVDITVRHGCLGCFGPMFEHRTFNEEVRVRSAIAAMSSSGPGGGSKGNNEPIAALMTTEDFKAMGVALKQAAAANWGDGEEGDDGGRGDMGGGNNSGSGATANSVAFGPYTSRKSRTAKPVRILSIDTATTPGDTASTAGGTLRRGGKGGAGAGGTLRGGSKDKVGGRGTLRGVIKARDSESMRTKFVKRKSDDPSKWNVQSTQPEDGSKEKQKTIDVAGRKTSDSAKISPVVAAKPDPNGAKPPAKDAVKPAPNSADPDPNGKQPAKPTPNASKPDPNGAKPPAKGTVKPAPNSGDPDPNGKKPAKPTPYASKPAPNATKPDPNDAKAAPAAAKPAIKGSKPPTTEATKPSSTSASTLNAQKRGSKPAKPAENATKLAANAAKPAPNAAKPASIPPKHAPKELKPGPNPAGIPPRTTETSVPPPKPKSAPNAAKPPAGRNGPTNTGNTAKPPSPNADNKPAAAK